MTSSLPFSHSAPVTTKKKKKTFRVDSSPENPPGCNLRHTYTAFLFPAKKSYFSAGRRRLIHSPGSTPNQSRESNERIRRTKPGPGQSSASLPQSSAGGKTVLVQVTLSTAAPPHSRLEQHNTGHSARRNRTEPKTADRQKIRSFFSQERTERRRTSHTSRWRRNFLPSFFLPLAAALTAPSADGSDFGRNGATRRRKEKRKRKRPTNELSKLCGSVRFGRNLTDTLAVW